MYCLWHHLIASFKPSSSSSDTLPNHLHVAGKAKVEELAPKTAWSFSSIKVEFFKSPSSMSKSTVRLASILSLVIVVALLGCATTSHPSEKVAARTWNFPIEGQLASISVSDLVAVVQAMQPTKIYRLRIINYNRVEADTSDGWVKVGNYDKRGRHHIQRFHSEESPQYTEVERVHGVWQTGAIVVITY